MYSCSSKRIPVIFSGSIASLKIFLNIAAIALATLPGVQKNYVSYIQFYKNYITFHNT
jgi:hypothetical protein